MWFWTMLERIRRALRQNRGIVVNILGAFGIKGGALLINVLLLPAYIRFFRDSVVLGLWYTVLAVLNWMTLFDLGLGHSLRNRLPGLLERNDRAGIRAGISTTYLVMGAIALGLFLVGQGAAGAVAWNRVFGVPESVLSTAVLRKTVRVVLSGVVLSLVLRIVTAILYAMQHSALVNALTLAGNGLILAAVMILPSGTVEENLIRMAWVNAGAMVLPALVCTAAVFGGKLRDCLPSVRWFRRELAGGILREGLTLLWLNLVFLLVTSANEFLITRLAGAEYVVEYQVYHKIFNTAAMVISLALTPIWSAVTRAGARNDYGWILRVYRLFLAGAAVCFLGQLAVIPALQWVVDLWLGEAAIRVRQDYALLFACASGLFVLHNVNTSVSNGLSWFRLQSIWMGFAGVVFIPLAWGITGQTGSWTGIILANVLSMLPYEILAPVMNLRRLKKLAEE